MSQSSLTPKAQGRPHVTDMDPRTFLTIAGRIQRRHLARRAAQTASLRLKGGC